MISVLDYSVGNLTAFATIYRRLNIDVEIASTPEQVLTADHLILPGVGSFATAMDKLNASGLRDALDTAVKENETPLLGVCVGMQMLGNDSSEGGSEGLGYIPGHVVSMESIVAGTSNWLPHMGWNNVAPTAAHPLWNAVDLQRGFYFLHSYYFKPSDPEFTFAEVNYGLTFPCAVRRKNVYGFQFHPEKSLSNGVSLLRNFSGL